MVERYGVEGARLRGVVERLAVRAARFRTERFGRVFDEERGDAVRLGPLDRGDDRAGLDAGARAGGLDAGGGEARAGGLDAVDAPGDAPHPVGLADAFFALRRAAADLDRDVGEAKEEDARVAFRERAVEREAGADDVAPDAARGLHIGGKHHGVVHPPDEGAGGRDGRGVGERVGRRLVLDEEDARAVR